MSIDMNITVSQKLKYQRQIKHDKCIQQYENDIDLLVSQLEDEVLQISLLIRDELEEIDTIKLVKFYNNFISESYLILHQTENEGIQDFHLIKVILQQRKDLIDKYSNELEAIEVKRSIEMKIKMQKLISDLIQIGFHLPNEVEHFIEMEVYDLNRVITINRLSHLNILSLMRKKHIEIEIEVEQRWKDSMYLWRKLRHEKAIQLFINDLESEKYLNPSDRVETMKSIHQYQTDLYNQRMIYMNNIVNSIDIVSSNVIEESMNKLNDLYHEELLSIEKFNEILRNLQCNYNSICLERVELLRRELHVYQYLQIEPNRLHYIQRINEYLESSNDDTIIELWRVSGNLKSTLKSICTKLAINDQIIYKSYIDDIKMLLSRYLTSCLHIRNVLIDIGMETLLEKTRVHINNMKHVNNKHDDIMSMFQNLIQDMDDFIKIKQLDSRIHVVLIQMKQEFIVEIQNIQEISSSTLVVENMSRTNTIMKTNIGTTSNTINHIVNPMKIRNWYRSLCEIFYICDIPIPLKTILIELEVDLDHQYQCNDMIDNVIHISTNSILMSLQDDYEEYILQVMKDWKQQVLAIDIPLQNICNFYSKVSIIYEHHLKTIHQIDMNVNTKVFNTKEDHRLKVISYQEDLLVTCHELCCSNEISKCNSSYQRILEILNQLEEEYHSNYYLTCFQIDQLSLLLIHQYYLVLQQLLDFLSLELYSSLPLIQPIDIKANKSKIKSNNEKITKPHHPIELAFYSILQRVIQYNQKIVSNKDYVYEYQHIDMLKNLEVIQSFKDLDMTSKQDLDSYHGEYAIKMFLHELIFRFQWEDYFQLDESINTKSMSNKIINETYPFLSSNWNERILSLQELESLDEKQRQEYLHRLCECWIDLNPISHEDVLDSKIHLPLVFEYKEDVNTNTNTNTNNGNKNGNGNGNGNKNGNGISNGNGNGNNNSNMYLALLAHVKDYQSYKQCHSHLKHFSITCQYIFDCYSKLCLKIVLLIENQSYHKVNVSNNTIEELKNQYTIELEDQLRYHWPIKSRIEVDIRKPREMLILAHEMKLQRFIESIQMNIKTCYDSFESKRLHLQHLNDNYEKDLQVFQSHLIDDNLSLNQLKDELIRLRSFQFKSYSGILTLQQVEMTMKSKMLEYKKLYEDELSHLMEYLHHQQQYMEDHIQDFVQSCELTVSSTNTNNGNGNGNSNSNGNGNGNAYEFQLLQVLSPQELKDKLVNMLQSQPQYSPQELQVIHEISNKYKNEITSLLDEWRSQHLTSIQSSHITYQQYFSHLMQIYSKAYENLCGNECLGIKYGQPRFHASKRMKLEIITFDEHLSGSIDELLATLEFQCSEYQLEVEMDINHWKDMIKKKIEVESREKQVIIKTWSLLNQLRSKFYQRCYFLQVQKQPLQVLTQLPWIHDLDSSYELEDISNHKTIHEVFEDIENECKQQMVDVLKEYPIILSHPCPIQSTNKSKTNDKDKKKSDLAKASIPSSLQVWLNENRLRILGSIDSTIQLDKKDSSNEVKVEDKSQLEKSWGRLWNQLLRFEIIIQRNKDFLRLINNNTKTNQDDNEYDNEDVNDEDVNDVISIPKTIVSKPSPFSICLIAYTKYSLISIIQSIQDIEKTTFYTIAMSFQLEKEKHERSLRPSLAFQLNTTNVNISTTSLELMKPNLKEKTKVKKALIEEIPLNELQVLQQQEDQRHQLYIKHILDFIIDELYTKVFWISINSYLQELMIIISSFMSYLDTTIHHEVIQIPKGIEVPKIRLSTKRQRKALRLHQMIQQGLQKDESKVRTWSSIDVTFLLQLFDKQNLLIDKLRKGYEYDDVSKQESNVDIKNKKVQKSSKTTSNSIPTPTWESDLKKESTISSSVSSGHRQVISDRDKLLSYFSNCIEEIMQETFKKYELLLREEDTWCETWKRQVHSLQQINI